MNLDQEIVKIVLHKIKDEILIFAVFSILVIVSFPQLKIWVFFICVIVIILYAIIKINFEQKKDDSKFFDNFSKYLKDPEKWEKRIINNSEVFFCIEDNNYQIQQAEGYGKEWMARESWMKNFPDLSIFEYLVYLKYGESIIANFTFLSCDGGRYFIPLPEKRCLKEDKTEIECLEWEYFWDKSSIYFKLGVLFRRFYNKKSIQEVAEFCNIKIK